MQVFEQGEDAALISILPPTGLMLLGYCNAFMGVVPLPPC